MSTRLIIHSTKYKEIKTLSKQEQSIYWHDYETSGIDPQRDRPMQFAGVRTDLDLNIIGEPLVIYCKPANDFLPNPQAALITGITPQIALAQGFAESEFIKQIHQAFSKSNTCVAGYNSIRFDDEVSRNTLYRNFYDPYQREYQNGNSRWDIIDMIRLTRALRPQGINWPIKEDGSPSFRLEELTQANGISHESAHDALSDVIATIELSKLIKSKHARLYQFIFELRNKHKARDLLNVAKQQAIIHVSSKYPAIQNCIALVLPIAADPNNNNGVVVFDLSKDPALLLDRSAEDIRKSLFTPSAELAGTALEERTPIKTVHTNKCPVLAPTSTMSGEDAERLQIDTLKCKQNLELLVKHSDELQQKINEVFSQNDFLKISDPDLMIYSGGFFSTSDRNKMNTLRKMDANALANAQENLNFDDERIYEMLFRYRARNHLNTLSPEEKDTWQSYRVNKFENPEDEKSLSIKQFDDQILAFNQDPSLSAEKKNILSQLTQYREDIYP